jgi:hypothetical protein
LRFLLLRCCRQSRSDSSRLIQRPMMSLEAMAKEFRESCMIITHMWHRENFRNMCAAEPRTDWKRIMRPSADTDGRAFAAVPRRERGHLKYTKKTWPPKTSSYFFTMHAALQCLRITTIIRTDTAAEIVLAPADYS